MTRQPRRTILATWHAMLTVQTIGSIDGQHRLPAPRQYVAHSVVWGILFLMADTGFSKLAARLSVLILLTATVVGPFGKKAVSFLQNVAGSFGSGGTTTANTTAPNTAPGSPLQQPVFN